MQNSTNPRSDPVLYPSEVRATAPVPVYITPNPSQSPQNTLWVVDLLSGIRQHLLVVAALVAAGAALGWFISSRQPKVYRAHASLEVQSVNENFLSFRDLSPTAASGGYDSDLLTQAKMLRSNAVLKRTVAKLEQAGSGPHPYSKSELLATAQTFKVSVAERSRILDLFADAHDPKLAADFVNGMADEFVAYSLEARLNSARKMTDWLSGQLRDLKARLEQSERQLQAYAGSANLLVTSDKGNLAEEKLRQLQQELARAEADSIAKQSRLNVARTSPPESLPDVLDSAVLRDYQSKLTDLRRQLAELQSQYTPGYYKVERVQAQISSLQASFAKERANTLERIRNEYEDSAGRARLLATAYQNQMRIVSDQASKSVHYDTLKHEVDTTRQLYEGMLQKVKEAGLASAMRASNIQMTDPADVPGSPSGPNPAYGAAFGAFGGLALGICFAKWSRRSDRRFHEPGDAARILDVPELGSIFSAKVRPTTELRIVRPSIIPDAHARLEAPEISRVAARSADGVELSLLDESYRNTAASLLIAQSRRRVFVMASAEPMAGKTTIVSNLGRSFAALGTRVLLVDADLRKPALHEMFDISNELGLADQLKGAEPLDSVALPVKTSSGVYVLPAGCNGETSALYSRRMADLVLRFRRDFDLVLIDTPAMLHLSDARAMGRLADAVILVVRANSTDRDAATAVRQRLAQDGTPILGTILNDWNPEASEYGYYHPKHFHSYYE